MVVTLENARRQEFDIDRGEADQLAQTELVQHGSLPIAPEISLQDLDNQENLLKVWWLGHLMFRSRLCRWRYFAYTQIPPATLQDHQIGENLQRAIYIPSRLKNFFPDSDLLILNPTITDASQRSQINLEGCGSIYNGKAHMLIARPSDIWLTGYTWSPRHDQTKQIRWHIQGWDAGGMDHEAAHLNGCSALSLGYVDKIADLKASSPIDFYDQSGMRYQFTPYMAEALRQQFGFGFISFNPATGLDFPSSLLR